MSNRLDVGSESTNVHASLWRSVPSKRNILEPFCCLENTSCTFAALWPRQFQYRVGQFGRDSFETVYVIQFGSVEFGKIYAKWQNDFQCKCPSNSILSSICSQINPFPLYCEARNFLLLITVCGVLSCIELHRKQLE